MKAFILDRHGRAVALRMADLPEPAMDDDEVLVEVHAASVNVLDSKIRSGEFKLILPYRFPLAMGHDLAGIVVRVGSRVQRFKVGDEVYARAPDFAIGSFAEFIAITESALAHKPKNLSMEEAASIPLVGLTAWQALVDIARLRPGQKVFIKAGSGGFGNFGNQIEKNQCATVAETTSESNLEWEKHTSTDVVIDYRKDDFETRLRDYDVVLNSQDGKTLQKSLRILQPSGRLISISGPPDPRFAQDIGAGGFVKLVLRLLSAGVRRRAKRLGVAYDFLFMKPSGHQLEQITSLIESGVIRPVLDKVFPFEATNDAIAHVETGRAKGKVVIKIK